MLLIKEEHELFLKCHILANTMGCIQHMIFSCVQAANGKINNLIMILERHTICRLVKWRCLTTQLSLLSLIVALTKSLIHNYVYRENISTGKWHSIILKDSKFWSSEIPWENNSDQAYRQRQGLRQVKSDPNCHLILALLSCIINDNQIRL